MYQKSAHNFDKPIHLEFENDKVNSQKTTKDFDHSFARYFYYLNCSFFFSKKGRSSIFLTKLSSRLSPSRISTGKHMILPRNLRSSSFHEIGNPLQFRSLTKLTSSFLPLCFKRKEKRFSTTKFPISVSFSCPLSKPNAHTPTSLKKKIKAKKINLVAG